VCLARLAPHIYGYVYADADMELRLRNDLASL